MQLHGCGNCTGSPGGQGAAINTWGSECHKKVIAVNLWGDFRWWNLCEHHITSVLTGEYGNQTGKVLFCVVPNACEETDVSVEVMITRWTEFFAACLELR